MNVSATLKALALIPTLWPLAKAVVQDVETLLPDNASKFAAAKATVEKYLTTIESDAEVVAAALPKIGGLINAAVALFNATGLFQHAAAGVARVAAAVEKGVAVGQAIGGAIPHS